MKGAGKGSGGGARGKVVEEPVEFALGRRERGLWLWGTHSSAYTASLRGERRTMGEWQ
jgi:hypothetical protein